MLTDSAEAKLRRSRQHIAALRELNQQTEQACVSSITSEWDSVEEHYVYTIGVVPSVPEEFVLILGDALHNLRSALDHLARAIILHEQLIPIDGPGGTSWPIRTAPDRGPRLKPEPSAATTAIVDGFQPYHDQRPDRHPLAVLQELDNADKHRQLLVAVVKNHGAGWFGPMEPVAWNPLRPNSELARIRLDLDENGVVRDPTFHFGICFDEPAVPAARRQTAPAHEYVQVLYNYVARDVLAGVHALLA
jgi:hypothetical protein